MRPILLLFALVLALGACAAPPAPPDVARAIPADQGFAAILDAARAGLPPATPHPLLTAAAQAHAQDMATHGYISHQGRDGADHMRRIRASGYCTTYAVENLAWDWPSVERAAQEWVRSAKHLENMRLSGRVDYGLGVAGERYVLVLARPC